MIRRFHVTFKVRKVAFGVDNRTHGYGYYSSSMEVVIMSTPEIIRRYHVFHICHCEKCNGKVWSHSQADWDEHLRFQPNGNIETKPIAELRKHLKG